MCCGQRFCRRLGEMQDENCELTHPCLKPTVWSCIGGLSVEVGLDLVA